MQHFHVGVKTVDVRTDDGFISIRKKVTSTNRVRAKHDKKCNAVLSE